MSALVDFSSEKRLEEISKLSDMPGWQLFLEVAAMSEQQALSALLKVKTGDETMYFKGVYNAARDLRTWAEREVAACTAAILAREQEQP